MEEHKTAVLAVSASVKGFFERKQPFRIYHGSTNSTRPSNYERDKMVDTSKLTRVVSVDKEAKMALVEPNVPMDQLVTETLKYGLIPPVVMEFKGITSGGGFAGTSGESSSFKYGFFDCNVESIEVVLANGDVRIASQTEDRDLLIGAAGSFGTIGVVTLLELRLIDAKKFVELTYWPVKSIPEAVSTVEEKSKDTSIDYLDGILFSLNLGAIMTGKLTDTPGDGVRTRQFERPKDEWFYIVAENNARSAISGSATQPVTEAIPLFDYLFRYDRGAFWTAKYSFDLVKLPFTKTMRYIVDPWMHTRRMYSAMHHSGLSQRYIIQDLALPASSAQDFIEWVDKEFGFYPLWLCPLQPSEDIPLHPHVTSPEKRKEMLLNVGVWGPGKKEHADFVEQNRSLEAKVRDLHGMKWLYAHCYYTEEEFWQIYDREIYDSLREKYGATSLPTVYQKVKVDTERQKAARKGIRGKPPFNALYGIAKSTMGEDYLLNKRKK